MKLNERIDGYCVKCRAMRTMVNPDLQTIKVKGKIRYIIKGRCPVCNTKMNKFTSKD